MIVNYDDIESILDEWFADYSILGKVEIAKLYSQIERVCEKNLRLFLESDIDNETD